MKLKEIKCQAGCIAFSGMEIKHHHDCVHYPGSMSKIYDRLKERTTSQQQTIERLYNLSKKLFEINDNQLRKQNIWKEYSEVMDEAEQLLSTTEPIDQ